MDRPPCESQEEDRCFQFPNVRTHLAETGLPSDSFSIKKKNHLQNYYLEFVILVSLCIEVMYRKTIEDLLSL